MKITKISVVWSCAPLIFGRRTISNTMGDSVKMAAIGGARMGCGLATLGKMCALLCGRFIS